MKKLKDQKAGVPQSLNVWGKAKHSRLPSGAKLVFEQDEDALLKFVTMKDISDKLGKDAGEVMYAVFWDGRRLVNMPMSFALTEADFIKDKWYYVLNGSEVEMGPGKNNMKDFDIWEIGETGYTIECPERIHPSGQITLTDESVAEVNYTRLNYPLRAEVKAPEKKSE